MNRLLLILLMSVATFSGRADSFLHSLPDVSTVLSGYESVDTVSARMDALPLSHIEGIWQMANGEGAVFAIERAEPSTDIAPTQLRIVMIRSPWRSIRPGTLVGHLVATPNARVYEARIYASFAQRSGLSIPRSFTIELSTDRELLTFKPFKSPLKINLFKLLPYMYRRVITIQESRPSGLDGAIRIFPRSATNPLSPIYL